jgi:hypothetical protein
LIDEAVGSRLEIEYDNNRDHTTDDDNNLSAKQTELGVINFLGKDDGPWTKFNRPGLTLDERANVREGDGMSKKEGDNRAISLLTNDEFPLPPIKCGWLIDTHRCQVELKFCTQTHAYTRKIGALLPVRWSLVGSFFRPAPRPGNENSAAPSLRVSTEHVCNERQRRNFHNQ